VCRSGPVERTLELLGRSLFVLLRSAPIPALVEQPSLPRPWRDLFEGGEMYVFNLDIIRSDPPLRLLWGDVHRFHFLWGITPQSAFLPIRIFGRTITNFWTILASSVANIASGILFGDWHQSIVRS
jgi:hypothetical protein